MAVVRARACVRACVSECVRVCACVARRRDSDNDVISLSRRHAAAVNVCAVDNDEWFATRH
jgi:hypothetical protein